MHTQTKRIEVDARQADGSWSTETIDDGEVSRGRGSMALDEVYARSSLSVQA